MSQNKQQLINNNSLINDCIEQVQNSLVSEYKGEYTITPTTQQQSLATTKTVLNNDIIINAIPYAKTTNEKGGTTVTIGG